MARQTGQQPHYLQISIRPDDDHSRNGRQELMPALSLDLAQTKLFTSILKKQKGDLRLRAFYPSGHPFKSSDSGRKGQPSRSVVEEWQNEGRGVYAVINDGGDTDSETTACRAVFC